MAWRIDEHVLRGEIDCRIQGKIRGTVWLAGRATPLLLDLTGNPWSDLAGSLLLFENPKPVARELESLTSTQRGICRDVTASWKIKIPTVAAGPLWREDPEGVIPFRWSVRLHIEWMSDSNGQVLIASANYRVRVFKGALRPMTPLAQMESPLDFPVERGTAPGMFAR